MLRKYCTGLLVSYNSPFIRRRVKGRGWSIRVERTGTNHGEFGNEEIHVCASRWTTAQQATNLVYAALNLLEGELLVPASDEPRICYTPEVDPTSPFGPDDREFLEHQSSFLTAGIPEACIIASKASFDRRYAYALIKYQVSCELSSTPIMELDPSHSRNKPLTRLYNSHVRRAIAIIVAYSVIEELDLQIKSNRERPSKLESGEWNPEVKCDLEERLTKARVGLDETFLWTVRGPTRTIDAARSPRSHSKASWARGMVKDCYYPLVDAIAEASWLRSKVASHGLSKRAKSLSVHDVANVQHLARRLILESMGHWRSQERVVKRRMKRKQEHIKLHVMRSPAKSS